MASWHHYRNDKEVIHVKRMWEIKGQSERRLELYIYGDVESDRESFWSDEVTRSETSANTLRAKLDEAGELDEIDVYINSNGGSVFEGTAIYNQLKRHPARKVVHIDGFACSVASVIAMAGDEVIMPRNALMMIHNAWMAAVGNAAELRKAADDLDVINAAGRQAYLTKSNGKISEEKLIELMDAETWLTAEQCMELGFADTYAYSDADISDEAADKYIGGISAHLKQRIDIQRSLAAQLREYVTAPQPQKKETNIDRKPNLLTVLSGIKIESEDNR